MNLSPVALWIDDNEPCISLTEQNVMTNRPGKGLRRMQTVKVIRNDEPYEHQTDLGPASLFKTEEFGFVGAVPLGDGRWDVLETVGRLKGAANEYRAKYEGATPRNAGSEDLVKSFEQFATRRRDAKIGRTHFAV